MTALSENQRRKTRIGLMQPASPRLRSGAQYQLTLLVTDSTNS